MAETRTELDRDFGFWLNTGLDGQVEGYRCDGPVTFEKKHWWAPATGIYDFHLNPDAPLTWVLGRYPAELLGIPVNSRLQPCGEFLTDKGSVPACLHWAYERDRFQVWYLHDSMFEFRYIWAWQPGGLLYKHPVDRMQADRLMQYGIRAQDGSRFDGEFIFRVVHGFGRGVWNAHDKDLGLSQ